RMSARYMLKVTGWLLILLVAGLSAQAAGFLSAAGYFSGLSKPLWNSSWLLADEGLVGKALHSLVRYTARPTPVEIMFYFGPLAIVTLCARTMDRKHQAKNHGARLAATASAAALAFFLLIAPHPARALDEIYSPNAEPHELAFEYNGSRTFDGD